MDRSKFRYLRLAAAIVVTCIAACSPPIPTGGGYPPVSKEMLIGAEYSHRTGRDWPTGREDGKLIWTFSETEFIIKADGESLPPDLVDSVTGTRQAAKQITGTWDLQDESLLFSDVKIDGETEVSGERSTRIFPTGVIRIQTSDAQYVFSPARNKTK